MTTPQLLGALVRRMIGARSLGAGVRTFRLTVIANDLGSWTTLEEKIAEVVKFYAPVAHIVPTIIRSSMQLPYTGSYPGLAPLAVVNFDWYDENISLPRLADSDIVMLITPMPATPPTYGGIMTFANLGPWETTVFAQPENYHAYINGKDHGNINTLVMKHELAHAFYRMKDMSDAADRTHEHMYSGDPDAVLKDFFFGELTSAEIFSELIRKLNGALVALNIIKKRRALIVADQKIDTTPPTAAAKPGMKLCELAESRKGTDVSEADLAADELGCAESVSNLIKDAYGDFPIVISTITLAKKLREHPKFRRVLGEVIEPGDVIICVTGEGKMGHGHTGIVSKTGIMSNDSSSGKFNENYTLGSWGKYFNTQRGFPVYFYRRTSL